MRYDDYCKPCQIQARRPGKTARVIVCLVGYITRSTFGVITSCMEVPNRPFTCRFSHSIKL